MANVGKPQFLIGIVVEGGLCPFGSTRHYGHE
jgi:hypothetical protein